MGSQIRIGQEEQLAGILLTVARFQKPSEGGRGSMQSLPPQGRPQLQTPALSWDARTKTHRRCFKLLKLISMQHELDKPTNCTGQGRRRVRGGSYDVQLGGGDGSRPVAHDFRCNLARSSSRCRRRSLARQPRSTQLPNLRTMPNSLPPMRMRCDVREDPRHPI